MGVVGSMAGCSLPETKGKPTREQYEDFFPKSEILASDEVGEVNSALEDVVQF